MKNTLRALIVMFAIMCLGMSVNAQNAFPDADSTSGRFLIVENGLESLNEVVRLEIDIDRTLQFQIGIFDGDVSNGFVGAWDLTDATPTDACVYTLYADKSRDGTGTVIVKQWLSTNMPDNAWFVDTVNNSYTALGSDNKYHYSLEIKWAENTLAHKQNSFKVKASGRVSVLANQTFGVFGYHQSQFNLAYNPPLLGAFTSFDGNWRFNINIPNKTSIQCHTNRMLEIWDGDLDLGEDEGIITDTHDFNSPSVPEWCGPSAISEGGLVANPDDPSVRYSITSPNQWTIFNTNPSASREWEVFRLLPNIANPVSVPTLFNIVGDDLTAPDYWVPYLNTGNYSWTVSAPATAVSNIMPYGWGVTNAMYFRTNYEVTAMPVSYATRTQGFWSTHYKALVQAVNQRSILLGKLQYGDNQYQDLTYATLAESEAILWGNIAKQGNVKRSALGKARMQLGQQLVAAMANVYFLGTTTVSKGFNIDLISNARLALDGTDVNLILNYASQVDAFNNSGDSVPFADSNFIVGSADSQKSKNAATKTNGVIDPGPAFE